MSSNAADPDIIQEGDSIIIRMHDDKSGLLVKVAPDQKLGKTRLSLRSLVGSPYESVFELRNRTLVRVVDEEIVFDDDDNEDMTINNNEESNINTTIAGDNRNYNDTNNAQKYDNVAIEKLKEAGTSGKDIIKTLISNSDTWTSKTEFAQAKWLKRKAQKYIKRFRVVKASPTSICEVYYAKNKDKICGMRWDTMAQILSQSGIQANCRVIVFDTMVGLMLGAIAYRLRGFGRIMAVYAGPQPHFEVVSALNLDTKSLSIIQPIPSTEIADAVDDVTRDGFQPPNDKAISEAIILNEQMRKDGLKREPNPDSKPMNSSCRGVHELATIRSHLREGADRLIIASRYHPLSILKELVVLLAPGSPFVVYSEFMEPLTECYLYMSENMLTCRMSLTDTWMREFQTLPGRVHPVMFMPTSGGYILTGIYIGMTKPYSVGSI